MLMEKKGSKATTRYVERILVFSGGGLVSAVVFDDDKAKILVDWPESVALQSMALVAKIYNIYRKTGRRVIYQNLWVAYIPEDSDYIVMAKIEHKKYLLPVVGLIRRIGKSLSGAPEESSLIGELVVNMFKKYFSGSSNQEI